MNLSKKNINDHELLITLLQTCRSKQDIIRNALEQSMEPPSNDTDAEELDEADLASLLELNELLCSSIAMAESTLHMSTKSKREKPTKKKSEFSASKISQRVKEKDDSSWKQVDRKVVSSTATKAATKKAKVTENPAKANKSEKKTSKVANAETQTQKQEENPTPKSVESESSSINGHVTNLEPADDSAQQEKEKMARMLEEARKQAAAAR